MVAFFTAKPKTSPNSPYGITLAILLLSLLATACVGTGQPTTAPTAAATPAPKSAPAPAPAKASDYVPPPCASSDCDCKDFKTQQEAQEFFIWAGGPAQDPHRLDTDRDGIACESLPRR